MTEDFDPTLEDELEAIVKVGAESREEPVPSGTYDRDKPMEQIVREIQAISRSGAVDLIVVPPDIEAVWGNGQVDGTGEPAIRLARLLISQWGVEVFRGSELHRQAVLEQGRQKRLDPVRARFVPGQPFA